ncbi:MAG: carboxypeptidase regulatory-like domain-containing protein [Candidatus Omnitrophica bacterium]|nr:carboxypeptidase regulatory-like domain-containing protein [Candidatus Omnitrophota bacterium]
MKLKHVFFAFIGLMLLTAGNAFAGSTITGKIGFEGTAPEPEKIMMTADPYCAGHHKDGAVSQSVIVNSNNTLKNVFVYVKDGLGNQVFTAPKEPVVFDQNTCMYNPHIFGVQVGQPIEVLNSDTTLHNVHAMGEKNKGFNLGMPIKGMKLKKTFSEPEVMVKIKCDVHPWMSAYVGVLSHPFYAVSGDDGTFKIENLPAGTYTIETWHEKYGTQTQQVTVADGESKEANFSYKAA